MLCAGLCGMKGSQTTGKTHFKVPTAMGDQPHSWSPLRVSSSLLSQAQSVEHLQPPQGHTVGESILMSR